MVHIDEQTYTISVKLLINLLFLISHDIILGCGFCFFHLKNKTTLQLYYEVSVRYGAAKWKF